MSRRSLLVVAVFSLFAGSANATTEIPGMFDARSGGMAGTGVAHGANATAAYNNPAMLDGIEKMSATLDITPYYSQTKQPLMGRADEKDSNPVVPLFFAGGAYRVHERVVVGLAVFPTAGMSAVYKDKNPAGGDLEMSASLLELSVPVSVRLLDNLSLGLAWRATYVMETMGSAKVLTNQQGEVVINPATSQAFYSKTDLDLAGMSFAGVEAGLKYQPMPTLTVGLAYRSPTTTSLSGDTKVTLPAAVGDAEMKLDTTSEFKSPHGLRAGGALTLLDSKLLVALEGKYLFYKSANKETTITTKSDLTSARDDTVATQWKNALSIHVGAEYAIAPMLKGRLGYSYIGSASNEETYMFYQTIPGALHAIHAGVGVPVNQSLSIDAAMAAALGNNSADSGDYSTTKLLGLLSATYSI